MAAALQARHHMIRTLAMIMGQENEEQVSLRVHGSKYQGFRSKIPFRL